MDEIIKEKLSELLKTENLKSIEITFNNEQQPDMIKVKQHMTVEKASRVSDNIKRLGYQTINIKTRNGSIVYSEIITNYKISV